MNEKKVLSDTNNLLYTKDLTTEQIGEISDEFMDVLILT